MVLECVRVRLSLIVEVSEKKQKWITEVVHLIRQSN